MMARSGSYNRSCPAYGTPGFPSSCAGAGNGRYALGIRKKPAPPERDGREIYRRKCILKIPLNSEDALHAHLMDNKYNHEQKIQIRIAGLFGIQVFPELPVGMETCENISGGRSRNMHLRPRDDGAMHDSTPSQREKPHCGESLCKAISGNKHNRVGMPGAERNKDAS